MIIWKEEYSTGVPELDEHHKSMFLFVNNLEDIIRDGYDSESMVLHAIDYLEDYAIRHFRVEEKCMHEHQCPVAQKNKDAHRSFLEQFEIIKGRMDQENDLLILEDLHKMAETWLIDHICKVDVHLKSCIKQTICGEEKC